METLGTLTPGILTPVACLVQTAKCVCVLVPSTVTDAATVHRSAQGQDLRSLNSRAKNGN